MSSEGAKWREETAGWKEAHADERESRRRLESTPKKLSRLGLDKVDRSANILDLCCGHGEALETLYSMGFRNLYGADISPDPRLMNDPRFKIQVCDAANTPFEDGQFDWILIMHALHHLGLEPQIALILKQCKRILKPGGRLAIIDFPNSPQIMALFQFMRLDIFLWTPYLKNFGRLVREEWYFLKDYLPQFPKVRRLLLTGGDLEVERQDDSFWIFYWTLRKPALLAPERVQTP